MKNVDYIIVGDGYAALFFAHQLIKNNKSFVLYSEGKKGASQISAGVINPVVLKRFTNFWLAQEQIDCLKSTLQEIEKYTNQNYFIDSSIHRIFHDEAEQQLWQKKCHREDLLPFLSEKFDSVEGVKNDFLTGEVLQSGRLDVSGFFDGLLTFLRNNEYLIQEKFDYSQIDIQKLDYKNFKFKNIVFCEGMGVTENPYFSEIPVIPNKGHHIKVALSKPIAKNCTIKKKHFLFPLKNDLYFYGGTYERDQFHYLIDDSAVEQLKSGLEEIYPDSFEIKEINFGFRPTVQDRRPIIGRHQNHENLYVYNGLGARGILNGCYFAEQLYNHIEKQVPLNEEVSIERFYIKKDA